MLRGSGSRDFSRVSPVCEFPSISTEVKRRRDVSDLGNVLCLYPGVERISRASAARLQEPV